MDLRLDHVTVAGRSLDDLDAAFEGIGLPPTYGGAHSNGVTHMSTLPFPDGTYVECISTREAGAASPWWDAHIRSDAGPCAWCVRVDDASEAAETLRGRGVAVDGPHPFARERPDGTRLEWELVYLGEGDPGSVLPFCIADGTPRRERMGEPLTGTGIRGTATVVVGVPGLDEAAARLREAFDLGAPTTGESERLGATLARFGDAPMALAAPTGDGWLADRLDTVGASPCAYLLEAESGATDRYPVAASEPWGARGAAWLDPDAVGGIRHLGLLERA